jgi:hypothetical protein
MRGYNFAHKNIIYAIFYKILDVNLIQTDQGSLNVKSSFENTLPKSHCKGQLKHKIQESK